MTPRRGRIVVVRHGQTSWSASGRHTGRTDVPLTAEGERQARALAARLSAYDVGLVLSSPLQRARRTAELAGLVPVLDLDLVERGYGRVEGLTTVELRIALGDPTWNVWESDLATLPPITTPPDAVESAAEPLQELALRVQRVLDRANLVTRNGRDVLLFSHAHTLRVLAVTWMRQPPTAAEHLTLDPAHLGVLDHERDSQVLAAWNLPGA